MTEPDMVGRIGLALGRQHCDANNGGDHEVLRQGKYAFCTACGETIRKSELSERAARRLARAALEAMREPTPKMIAAALKEHEYSAVEWGQIYSEYSADPSSLSEDAPAEIWETMIDEALKAPS